MQNAGRYIPPRTRLQLVCLGVIQDPVIPLVPALEAAPHVFFGRAWFQPHEGIRKIVLLEVILRWKIVSLGFGLASDPEGMLLPLVHVVGDRSLVVEKFAQDVPAAFASHYTASQQDIAQPVDGFL